MAGEVKITVATDQGLVVETFELMPEATSDEMDWTIEDIVNERPAREMFAEDIAEAVKRAAAMMARK